MHFASFSEASRARPRLAGTWRRATAVPVGVSCAFFRPSKSSMDSLIFVVRALWVDAFVGFHLGLFGGDIFLQHQSTEEAIQAVGELLAKADPPPPSVYSRSPLGCLATLGLPYTPSEGVVRGCYLRLQLFYAGAVCLLFTHQIAQNQVASRAPRTRLRGTSRKWSCGMPQVTLGAFVDERGNPDWDSVAFRLMLIRMVLVIIAQSGKQQLDAVLLPLLRLPLDRWLLWWRQLLFLTYFPLMGLVQGPVLSLITFYGANTTWWLQHVWLFRSVELLLFQLCVHALFVPPYSFRFFRPPRDAGLAAARTRQQFREAAHALLGEGASVVGPAEVAAAYAPASGGGKPKPEGGGGQQQPASRTHEESGAAHDV
uniref:Uncharacterized protein n=3 Tax=Emiliania huxleyi TaxID=2903 RepID=A0A7S3RN11_EMIHU